MLEAKPQRERSDSVKMDYLGLRKNGGVLPRYIGAALFGSIRSDWLLLIVYSSSDKMPAY